MTKSLVHEPLPSVVPPRFDRVPYCSPEHQNGAALDVLINYDPDTIASRADFLNNLSATYDDDKGTSEGATSTESDKPTEPTDLRRPDHLEGMTSHTLAHTLTGWLDAGVSDTDCIPYWDREAVAVGLQYQDPEHAGNACKLLMS